MCPSGVKIWFCWCEILTRKWSRILMERAVARNFQLLTRITWFSRRPCVCFFHIFCLFPIAFTTFMFRIFIIDCVNICSRSLNSSMSCLITEFSRWKFELNGGFQKFRDFFFSFEWRSGILSTNSRNFRV